MLYRRLLRILMHAYELALCYDPQKVQICIASYYYVNNADACVLSSVAIKCYDVPLQVYIGENADCAAAGYNSSPLSVDDQSWTCSG